MRAQMWTAQRVLRGALQAYNAASDAEAMRDALLTLHAAFQEALSSYLGSQRNAPRNVGGLRFPALVDAAGSHTDLLRGDDRAVRVLLALDAMRIQISNPGKGPSPQQVAREATRSAKVAQRLWPRLFDEPCPIALDPAKAGPLPERLLSEAPPEETARRGAPPDEPSGATAPPAGRLTYGMPGSGLGERADTPQRKPQEAAAPAPSRSKRLLGRLRMLWADSSGMPLRWDRLLGRLLALVVLLYMAQRCRQVALSSARWPTPIRYVSFMLVAAAAGLLVWALIVAWRLLWQIKLRRLAAAVGIAYLLAVVVSLLTSQRALSIGEEWWLITRQSVSYVARKTGGFVWTVLDTPAALRFAYTGTRRPQRLAGMDRGALARLTPMPANVPQRAPTPTPTPTPTLTPMPPVPAATLPPQPTPTPTAVPTRAPGGGGGAVPPTPAVLRAPNCPHPQARLTVPRVNEVIDAAVQVQGSANIEQLDYYKFEFRRRDVEDEWHWAASYETPVENGPLGVWETAHLPAGTYTLRLTAVNAQGNYPFPPCDVTVQIRH